MNVKDVIKTITIKAKAEGVPETTQALKGLQAAQEGVARSAEASATITDTSAKRQLSLADAVNKAERRFNVAIRAQQDYEKVQRQMNAAVAQNPALQERANAVLGQARTHYDQITAAAARNTAVTQSHTKAVGLQRHEMINLSRQFQDVAVSMQAGQSPLTILIQQGSQIADIYGSSQGTVKGFFEQMVSGAARVFTPLRLVAGGIVAIGSAALYAGSSFTAAQKEIDRALIGVGQRSGAVRNDINAIAKSASAGSTLSIGEAREAALEFVKTGQIYRDQIAGLVKVTDNFAIVTGQDTKEAAQQLAKALSGDLVKGTEALNQSLGFADGKFIGFIRTLQSQGREQEAIRAITDRMGKSIEGATETLGPWERGWRAVKRAASEAFEATGKAVAGQTDPAVLAERQLQLQAQMERFGPPQGRLARQGQRQTAGEADKVGLELEKQRADDLQKSLEAAGAQMRKFSTDADAATKALIPQIDQIDALKKQLVALERAQKDAFISGRMDQGASLQPAIAANKLQTRLVEEQKVAAEATTAEVMKIANAYQGVSVNTALALAAQKDQLNIATATTGQARARATEEARVNQLALTGVERMEGMKIAAAERAVAEAQINQQIMNQVKSLEDEVRLIQARADGVEAAVKGEIAYEDAIRAGASRSAAASLQDATTAAAQAQTEQMQQQQLAQAKQAAYNAEQAAIANLINQAEDLAYQWARIAGAMVSIDWYAMEIVFTRMGNVKLWTDPTTGQFVQFNPEGYQSTIGGTGSGAPYQAATMPEMMKLQEMLAPKKLEIKTYDDLTKAFQTLVTSNKDLANSTDALNATIGNMLSPYYSQDPRTTKLGYRVGTRGNPDWMTPGASNDNPVGALTGWTSSNYPGFANGGEFTVPGGYSSTDNKIVSIAARSGERVSVATPEQQRQVVIDNSITINGSVDQDTMRKLKQTQFQQAQRMRSALAV